MPTQPSVVLKSGFVTSEFVTLVGVVATNVVMMLVMSGRIPAADQQGVTDMVLAVVTGLGGLVVNGFALWKYIAGRTEVKTAFLEKIDVIAATHPTILPDGKRAPIQV